MSTLPKLLLLFNVPAALAQSVSFSFNHATLGPTCGLEPKKRQYYMLAFYTLEPPELEEWTCVLKLVISTDGVTRVGLRVRITTVILGLLCLPTTKIGSEGAYVRLRELLQKGNRCTLALASDKPNIVVKTLLCTVRSLEDLGKEFRLMHYSWARRYSTSEELVHKAGPNEHILGLIQNVTENGDAKHGKTIQRARYMQHGISGCVQKLGQMMVQTKPRRVGATAAFSEIPLA
ncbi:hypothetical protein DFH06DRAFT_1140588 [Mycena polygramma]|nr:hypothetical protein DFH06DRAFT_1140588 [Mycena polygramma]